MTAPGTLAREKEEPDGAMSAIAKGLAIIECFGREHPRLTVTQAATLTGQTPPAARRCMRTLESLGYLGHDGKYYRPTPRLARLARSYLGADPVPQFGEPLLIELRDRHHECASLAILDGADVLFVARAEDDYIVSTGMPAGRRLPAARTALGRVLLGGLDDDALADAVERGLVGPVTSKAITSADAVIAAVRTAAEQGYAVADEEVEQGLRSIAVPVVGRDGQTVAAMSISALSVRVDLRRMLDEFLPAVRDAAERLGKML